MRKSPATKSNSNTARGSKAKLTRENALLGHMKFAAQSEKFNERLNAEQRSLLENEIETSRPRNRATAAASDHIRSQAATQTPAAACPSVAP
jgi:hypothetical protein